MHLLVEFASDYANFLMQRTPLLCNFVSLAINFGGPVVMINFHAGFTEVAFEAIFVFQLFIVSARFIFVEHANIGNIFTASTVTHGQLLL